MPKIRKLPEKESNHSHPPLEIEVNRVSSLGQKFVQNIERTTKSKPKTSEMKGSKATERKEQEEIASTLLLCDSFKKSQKHKEEKLPPPHKTHQAEQNANTKISTTSAAQYCRV